MEIHFPSVRVLDFNRHVLSPVTFQERSTRPFGTETLKLVFHISFHFDILQQQQQQQQKVYVYGETLSIFIICHRYRITIIASIIIEMIAVASHEAHPPSIGELTRAGRRLATPHWHRRIGYFQSAVVI